MKRYLSLRLVIKFQLYDGLNYIREKFIPWIHNLICFIFYWKLQFFVEISQTFRKYLLRDPPQQFRRLHGLFGRQMTIFQADKILTVTRVFIHTWGFKLHSTITFTSWPHPRKPAFSYSADNKAFSFIYSFYYIYDDDVKIQSAVVE